MSQPVHQQFDPKTIETLKAARNQVVQAPLKAMPLAEVDVVQKSSKGSVEILVTGQTHSAARSNFAEEFIQKLTSIEQETAAIDEEITKMEKIWLNLTEKKEQLEDRRNELIKVKDKLKELDKEMGDVLSKEL